MEYTCIEMTGLPGSGKTTLADSLGEDIRSGFLMQDDFYKCLHSKGGKFKTFFYCMSKNFFKDMSFMNAVAKASEEGNKKKAKKKVLKLLRFKGIQRRTKNKCLLCEGYVQAFLEIADFLTDDALIKNDKIKDYFVKDITSMDKSYYVFLQNSPEVSLARISKRHSEVNTVDQMNETARAAFIAKRYKNAEYVFKLIRDILPDTRMLVLDAEKTLEVNTQLLSAFIKIIKEQGTI